MTISNPNAHSVANLTKRHEQLMKLWKFAKGRFGPNQKAELWGIESALNQRTKPAIP